MDSKDSIYEKIRNKKIDDIGRFLNNKLKEIKIVLDEKNKQYDNPQELKEFLRRR